MDWFEDKHELEMNKAVFSFECMTTLVTLGIEIIS